MKKSKKQSNQSVNMIKIGAMILFITLPFAAFFAGMTYQEMKFNSQPVSYEDCVSLPNSRLLENDPSTCVTLDGVRYTESSETIINGNRDACEGVGGIWMEEHRECEGVGQVQCEQISGAFTSCASPCRHDPDYPDVECTYMCLGVCTLY